MKILKTIEKQQKSLLKNKPKINSGQQLASTKHFKKNHCHKLSKILLQKGKPGLHDYWLFLGDSLYKKSVENSTQCCHKLGNKVMAAGI